MECVYPHCDGSLSVGSLTGYCSTCRRPASHCLACRAWNRSSAAFCQTCGKPLTLAATYNQESFAQDSFAAEGLPEAEPSRATIEEAIRTLPQARAGFLWAMGEQGNLYRINPHERPGRLPEVCTRLWAMPTPHAAPAHAFVIRELERSPGSELTEAFAIASTAERITAWGLVSQSTRVFEAGLPGEALQAGEEILADARDRYQFIEAAGSSAYCLTRNGDSTSLIEVNLPTRQATRYPLELQPNHVTFCGPALVQGRVVAWSSSELLTLAEAGLERHPLPPGVELWTAPAEDSGLRLPLGRPPCMVVGNSIYLPCNHYGAPALLRAQALHTGWSMSSIPIPNASGTLAQDSESNPLLASGNRLFRCIGNSFRELVADDQLSGQFAAFHAGDLSIFFCEGDYGLRRHRWLQAQSSAGQRRVNWSLEGNQVLKECGGFWMIGDALVTQLLVEDRHTTTEFVSWHR